MINSLPFSTKVFCSIVLVIPLQVFAQQTDFTKPPPFEKKHARILFYNVENLFDTEDDSLKRDDEFLPSGMKGWTQSRYWNKLRNIYKNIIAVGEWAPPVIVGLCEIENRTVLYDLVSRTPLRTLKYQIIHEESPDRRGIDVGLLYRPGHFKPLKHEAIRITFPNDTARKTRDILYVKGRVFKQDTIHVFINHWPSRSGGQEQSAPRRKYVADVLRKKTDSLFAANPNAYIIITGDFNDEPLDESLVNHLGALTDTNRIEPGKLYNMMYPFLKEGVGTEKHHAQWHVLDQFIVSGSLLNEDNLNIRQKQAFIFSADWLLEPDEKYMGQKPFRTYVGPRYTGGYSDHLPVYLDLVPGNN